MPNRRDQEAGNFNYKHWQGIPGTGQDISGKDSYVFFPRERTRPSQAGPEEGTDIFNRCAEDSWTCCSFSGPFSAKTRISQLLNLAQTFQTDQFCASLHRFSGAEPCDSGHSCRSDVVLCPECFWAISSFAGVFIALIN
jgi:hypothetical protein